MAKYGLYTWIILFTIVKVVYPLVNMELQVLQFHNPLGTSYTKHNLNSGRKCCDSGGSDCISSSDKCDVYFVFCFGRYDLQSPGCQGTSIDMDEDVSNDVLQLSSQQAKHLHRNFNVTNWNSTKVIVQVLDIDAIPTDSMNDPHVFPDLIDTFENDLNFLPASNFWAATNHVISMVKHTSFDIQLRAWCAPGWYGKFCEHNDCISDKEHECTTTGKHLNIECTDPDIISINLQRQINQFTDREVLNKNITTFLANEVCPTTASHINVSVIELREQRNGSTDVVFTGNCDSTPISNLKIKETVHVMNIIPTRLTPIKDIFGTVVTSSGVKNEESQTQLVNMVIMVRIVNYVNMGSTDCTLHHSNGFCDPKFYMKFSWIKARVNGPTLLHSNNLTDCNGQLIDVKSVNDTNAGFSTMLFLLTHPAANISKETLLVSIGNLRAPNTIATHNFSLVGVHPGATFYDAQPKRFPTSTNSNTRLTIEVIAWCTNCYTGDSCQTPVANCNKSVTIISPSCRHSSDCMNGGTCQGATCHCIKGWVGPNCNVDIDECALGICKHEKSCTNTNGGYLCECSTGFDGQNCDEDLNECLASPCKIGSVCVNTYGSFACLGVCSDQEIGPNCTGIVDFCKEQPCQNNATCVSGMLNFTCTCTPGWEGSLCNSNVNECENKTLCKNGGTCQDTSGSFKCICSSSYTGTYCDVDADECLSGFCLNKAECHNYDGGYSCKCTSGFTGYNCSTDIDECKQNLCVHSSSCNNTIGSYSCNPCDLGWEGQNCDIDRDECLVVGLCANNGICVNTPGSFLCNCTEQWTGNQCHDDVNECDRKYSCNYHGNCTNSPGSFQCLCYQGWDGDTCNIDVDECLNLPCKNGGICNNTDGSFSCDCPIAWTGQTCNTHVDECGLYLPCKNGGTCANTETNYICSCPSNWIGQNCTVDVDECLNGNVCLNGGTCINTEGSFTCSCPPGWEGSTCNNDVNECLQQPCLHSGTCTNIAGSYTCVCSSAWTGGNCTVNVNECKMNPNICNHGVCSDTNGGFNCKCVDGYQGNLCNEDVNECAQNVCKNGGSCDNMDGAYICHCPKQWTGRNCETDYNECNDSPCLYGGTCNNTNGGFLCTCVSGRIGDKCENDFDECAHDMCKNGASCNNTIGSFVCTCAQGYEGNTCTIDINECSSVSCKNGGSCQDMIAGFKCICPTGYNGTYCDINIDDCSPNPCLNNGKCYDHIGYFECVCRPGWQGNLCYTDIDECETHPCKPGERCINTIGNYTCNPVFTVPSTPSTSTTTFNPNNLDVFSLQFVTSVTDEQRPVVKDGITNILKLLDCHDSSYIHVALVHNSIAKPNVVEFYAQCDGHHLTNSEVNKAIRTLSKNKLEEYFPNLHLASLQHQQQQQQSQSWIASNIPVVGCAAGGVVVLVVVVVVIICIRRKKTRTDDHYDQASPYVGMEIIRDMDGSETLAVRNPVYESMYKPESST